MGFREMLMKNRSYRRFRQEPAVRRSTLVDLVELTRLCPSAANRQPLKYLLVCDGPGNAKLFAHLRWARAIPGWTGPAEEERPTGYIVILGDMRVWSRFGVDPGIVAQSMLLGAVERGLGGCMLASIDRDGIRRDFAVPDYFSIELVVALGTPGETVVLEDAAGPDQIDYWRDAEGVHHVPKRPLAELVVDFSGP